MQDAVVNKDMNLFNLVEHIALDRVIWQQIIHVTYSPNCDTRLSLI